MCNVFPSFFLAPTISRSVDSYESHPKSTNYIKCMKHIFCACVIDLLTCNIFSQPQTPLSSSSHVACRIPTKQKGYGKGHCLLLCLFINHPIATDSKHNCKCLPPFCFYDYVNLIKQTIKALDVEIKIKCNNVHPLNKTLCPIHNQSHTYN